MMEKSKQTFKERELVALQYLVDCPLKAISFKFKISSVFIYDKAAALVWTGEPSNDHQKVFKDLLSGLTMKELAAQKNCSIQTIANRIKAAKLEIIEGIETKAAKGELKLPANATDQNIIEWMTEKKRKWKRKVDFYRLAKAYRFYFPQYDTEHLALWLASKPLPLSLNAYVFALRWKNRRNISALEAIFIKVLRGKNQQLIMEEHHLGSTSAVTNIINANLTKMTESIEKDIKRGVLNYSTPMPQLIPMSELRAERKSGKVPPDIFVPTKVLDKLLKRYLAN